LGCIILLIRRFIRGFRSTYYLCAQTAFSILKKIIVAIDGHSSCGKSTLAKDLAQALGYTYIDTGAMYRAVTLFLLRNDIPIEEGPALDRALDQIQIHQTPSPQGTVTYLNRENVEGEIRKMYVSEQVSQVAALSPVRRMLVRQQQLMGQQKGVVMDGRDIGTVVFPQAELKIFLTAAPDVRAHRRHEELLQKGHQVDLHEVVRNLQHRDHIDSTREDSPLKKAADAVIIDNSSLNRESQLELALQLANQVITSA
jgi:cytidylate kinase